MGRSPDILYWESTNLVSWSPMRRLPVMESLKDDIIFTWAPEWVWDEERKEYLVFWATFFRHWQGTAGCDNHTNIDRRHLFWSSRTTDWKTFTAPEMLFDPSCTSATFSPMNYSEGGIDGDILRAPNGIYHMVYKDGRSPERTDVDALQRTSGARMTSSTDLKHWSTPVPSVALFGTPWGIEGPELLTINETKMHLYYDCAWHKLPSGSGDPYPNPPYGVSIAPYPHGFTDASAWKVAPGSCTAWRHNQTAQVRFPGGATQGGFICLSEQEYVRLESTRWNKTE